MWLMSGTELLAGSGPVQTVSNANWTVVATADFNDDGRSDILWRRLDRGKNSLWFMSGAAIQPGSGPVQAVGDTSWIVVGGSD